MALVLEEIACSSSEGFTFKVFKSISTITGMRPFWIIGLIVVGNPMATVKTSSPVLSAFLPSFGLVSQLKAIRFAEDPEFTKSAYLLPTKSAMCFSNSLVNLPAVSQPSKEELTSA